MDRVAGELLIYRIRDNPYVMKEQLFAWFQQLLEQLIQYHQCHENQNYRYLNPYSVLVTRDGKLLLLNLDADSNEFVLLNLQKRAMRAHFVKPIVHITEGAGEQLDLYGYGKTIQFILANTNVEPSLSRFQENKLEKIINKCLNESPGKKYNELIQIKKELPIISVKSEWKLKKELLLAIITVISIVGVIVSCVFVYNIMKEQESIRAWIWEEEKQKEYMEESVTEEEIEEKIKHVQENLLKEIGDVQESVRIIEEQVNQHLSEMEEKLEREEKLKEETEQTDDLPIETQDTIKEKE